MKPQTSYTCVGKVRVKNRFYPACYQVSQITEGFIASEPGVLVPNSVVKIKRDRKLPLVIVNSTNKTVRLRKSCIVATAERIH